MLQHFACKVTQVGKAALIPLIFLITLYFGLFIVLVPLTYGLAGFFLYKDQGWKFVQPGVGGVRFIAFNTAGWTLYSVSMVLVIINLWLVDSMLSMLGFVTGLGSYTLIVSGLFTYSNLKPKFLGVDAPGHGSKLAELLTVEFNEELQLSKYVSSGETPSDLWYVFIGMQVLVTMFAFWINAGFLQSPISPLKILANLFSMWLFCIGVCITHTVGGKWKHINTNYAAFQPGKGGKRYVFFQTVGWATFSTSILIGLVLFVSQLQRLTHAGGIIPDQASVIVGILGLTSEAIITASLFFYKDERSVAISSNEPIEFQGTVLATSALLACLSALFKNPDAKERSIVYESSTDWLKGEQKFQDLLRDVKTTGDQYLVIGSGFLGKRLIKRLLERGETRIRVFDIAPNNPFEGDDRVEYVRGDVTKASSIGPVCRGVDTVYATFAIIRFMDRLEHQAALSYTINVVGTERVIEACKKCNVKRMVVTSSSHCTTDEHSQPRLGRDENSPYVVRETAHNHYGWTKAMADKLALANNGAQTENGGSLQVAILRPCSAIFGADDRLSFEKMLNMGVCTSIAAGEVLDWVYVENIVLGHLLLEDAMQNLKPVGGEAYCVSNNDPMSMFAFWMSVCHHIARMGVALSLDFVWIPMWPLWIIAEISEWNQRIFKGRVSLGADIDMMTPALLATVNMSYAYTSDKAKRDLGYEPAYTIDQAIQKSVIDYCKNYDIGGGSKKSK